MEESESPDIPETTGSLLMPDPDSEYGYKVEEMPSSYFTIMTEEEFAEKYSSYHENQNVALSSAVLFFALFQYRWGIRLPRSLYYLFPVLEVILLLGAISPGSRKKGFLRRESENDSDFPVMCGVSSTASVVNWYSTKSTIRQYDRILVLDGGKIVDDGTYGINNLLKRGRKQRLYRIKKQAAIEAARKNRRLSKWQKRTL